MNIILDLDGTLISEDLEGKNEIVPRPFLKEFLDFCFSTCETVSIWSAAKPEWCQYVYYSFLKPNLKKENKFFFIFDESNCTFVKDIDFDSDKPVSGYLKKLQKVWKKYKSFTKKNTFILDDTPITYSKNYGNAIPIRTYTGGKGVGDKDKNKDTELLRVMEKMKDICARLQEK